ncbi:YfhO family protein [bacterium]|nr:YfhO family protein [candidate division CSSED10-310 bacterium]
MTLLKRNSHFLAIGIYMAIILAFFNVEIRTGRTLVAGDSLYVFHPWSDLPVAEQRYQNFDQILQFYPWRFFINEEIHLNSIPLWNPESFCGCPFIGNVQSQCFYPFVIPWIVLSVNASFLMSAICTMLLSCLGAYFLALRLGCSPFAAITAGMIYGFSGFTVLWVGYPCSAVSTWAPWTILCIENLRIRPHLLSALSLAAVTALHLLGGHPETSLYLLIFAAVYACLRLVTTRQSARKAFAALCIAGWAMGFLLAMISFLPFLEYSANSLVMETREEKTISDAFIPTICLFLTILPEAFGTPEHNGFFFPHLFSIHGLLTYGEIAAPYMGIWTLFLAGIGVVQTIRSRKILIPLAVCGILSSLCVYGFPGFSAFLERIPVINLGFHLRMVFILNLAGAILAGVGLDGLLTLSPKYRIWPIAAVIVWFISLTFSVNILSVTIEQRINELDRSAFWIHEIRLFFIFLTSGAALILVGAFPRLRRLQAALPLVIFLELMRFGYGYNASISPDRIAPPHPVIPILRSHQTPQRLLGIESAFFPNTSMSYDLQDVRGYDAITPGLFYHLAEAFDPSLSLLSNADNPAYMLFNQAPVNLLRLFSVRFLVYPPWRTLESIVPDSDPSMFPVPEKYPGMLATRIREFTDPLPRFYTCRNTRLFTDDQAELSHLTSLDFRPGHEITVRQPVRSDIVSTQEPFFSIVEEIDRVADRIDLHVETSHAAVLASSELFYPGWRAYVDGVPAEVIRCNHAFRGMELPPGEHRVRFVYEPVSYRLGMFVTGMAILAFVAARIALILPVSRSIRKRTVSGC